MVVHAKDVLSFCAERDGTAVSKFEAMIDQALSLGLANRDDTVQIDLKCRPNQCVRDELARRYSLAGWNVKARAEEPRNGGYLD